MSYSFVKFIATDKKDEILFYSTVFSFIFVTGDQPHYARCHGTVIICKYVCLILCNLIPKLLFIDLFFV